MIKQTDNVVSGNQTSYNFVSAAEDTGIGGLGGLIPVPRISGINAGQGSFSAVEGQIVTKLENGTIESFSLPIGTKIAVNEIYTGTPGVVVEGLKAANESPDATGQNKTSQGPLK